MLYGKNMTGNKNKKTKKIFLIISVDG